MQKSQDAHETQDDSRLLSLKGETLPLIPSCSLSLYIDNNSRSPPIDQTFPIPRLQTRTWFHSLWVYLSRLRIAGSNGDYWC
jgi:hypothetical protein